MESWVRCVKERETLRYKQGWDDHSNSQNKLSRTCTNWKTLVISPQKNI